MSLPTFLYVLVGFIRFFNISKFLEFFEFWNPIYRGGGQISQFGLGITRPRKINNAINNHEQ